MWPGSGVLGRRRAQNGLQFVVDNQNVAWEWCSGNAKSIKWPTVGSGHSECGLGMVFWDHEEQKMAYSWLQALRMWPGNGILGTRRAESGLQFDPGTQDVAWEWCSGKMHRGSGQELHTF